MKSANLIVKIDVIEHLFNSDSMCCQSPPISIFNPGFEHPFLPQPQSDATRQFSGMRGVDKYKICKQNCCVTSELGLGFFCKGELSVTICLALFFCCDMMTHLCYTLLGVINDVTRRLIRFMQANC